MKNTNSIDFYSYKSLLIENNNKLLSMSEKPDFVIKHELKKQLKQMESILLNIPSTKQGKAFLKEVLNDEKVSAARYVSNNIRKIKYTYENYASLGFYLIALNDTKNHESANILTQDTSDCEFLNLNDPYKNRRYYNAAENLLRKDGVVIQNVMSSQEKQRYTDCVNYDEKADKSNNGININRNISILEPNTSKNDNKIITESNGENDNDFDLL